MSITVEKLANMLAEQSEVVYVELTAEEVRVGGDFPEFVDSLYKFLDEAQAKVFDKKSSAAYVLIKISD